MNFNVTMYYEMIDWSSKKLTPPPILKYVSNTDLFASIDNQLLISQWDFVNLPYHTQAVRWTVKLVTEAAKKFSDIKIGMVI